MPTFHTYPHICRPADVYTTTDPDRALRAEHRMWAMAFAELDAGCAAVRERRVIPRLTLSDKHPDGPWAPGTWEHRAVWLRIMSAVCEEPVCRHRTPEGRRQARIEAWEAASPVLRRKRRAAATRRLKRLRRGVTRRIGGLDVTVRITLPAGTRYAVAPLADAARAVRELAPPDRFAG